jgi:peptide/nickel transport system permease protein
MMRQLRRDPALWVGGLLVATLFALAILSYFPMIPDPEAIHLAEKLQGPSLAHWLGTDQLGRDLAARLMRGAIASLVVAVSAIAIGAGFGVPMGLFAASRESLMTDTLMRINDFLFAFPALILAIVLHDLIGAGMMNAILAIGLFNIPVFARITFNKAQSIWTLDFIRAARISGRKDVFIAVLHVFPLLAVTVIVQAAIQLGLAVLAEAGLSYVGLGVAPPTPSWGRMLNEAQTLMTIAPRLAFAPGIAITSAVFGFTLLGEALIKRIDPRTARA